VCKCEKYAVQIKKRRRNAIGNVVMLSCLTYNNPDSSS